MDIKLADGLMEIRLDYGWKSALLLDGYQNTQSWNSVTFLKACPHNTENAVRPFPKLMSTPLTGMFTPSTIVSQTAVNIGKIRVEFH